MHTCTRILQRHSQKNSQQETASNKRFVRRYLGLQILSEFTQFSTKCNVGSSLFFCVFCLWHLQCLCNRQINVIDQFTQSMNNLVLILLESISAVMALVLVRFMIKPYRMTGESRYLGLPLGFAFLGISYIFMGVSLFVEDPLVVDRVKWLQLFMGAYGFVFLAVTYYFSARTPQRESRIFMQAIVSLAFLILVLLFIILFLPPAFAMPSYKEADEYFRLLSMILAIYVTLTVLRSHALRPEPKTILAPLGYALLAFSQYSFLIWSLDSSFSAFAGAHIIRIASLLVFLFVSYKAITATPPEAVV